MCQNQNKKTTNLLCNDEHSDQEEGDINAAHDLWMLDQPYRPQDGRIFSAGKEHYIYKNTLKSSAVNSVMTVGFSLSRPAQNAHLLQFQLGELGAKTIFA